MEFQPFIEITQGHDVLGAPEAPRQRFLCRWFIEGMFSGETNKGVGEAGQGRKKLGKHVGSEVWSQHEPIESSGE